MAVGTTRKSAAMISDVVREERLPGLGWRAAVPDQVLRHGGLGELDTHLEQFAVDARRTPQRIGLRHGANQIPDLPRDGWPARAVTALPGPPQAEAATVPRDDGRRFDDHERSPPVRPDPGQPDPEPAIERGEPQSPRTGSLQDVQLMPHRKQL